MSSDHTAQQLEYFDHRFEGGSRKLVTSSDPLTRYLTRWRIETAWNRLLQVNPTLGPQSSVLVMCAGDAGEASVLADLGVANITITDLSPSGVRAALDEDPRLSGYAADMLHNDIETASYDVVVVQDGLHHLTEPVKGFTEMLRIARHATVFLEGSDSLAGRTLGLEWEVGGDATNYVFRWNRRMVQQVANSYLGPDSFVNASFSFWHHNVQLAKVGRRLGGGTQAVRRIRLLKTTADRLMPTGGNQFCGLVSKTRTPNPAPEA